MKFDERVFIVTGGSQGIGKELSRQLLKKGARVIIAGRTLERLIEAETELRQYGPVSYFKADVGSWDDCKALVDYSISHYQRLDGIIHNAGMSAFGKVADLEAGVIDEIINTNIRGIIYLTKLALPFIRQQKGALLFIGSLAGLHGLPEYSLYSLSKMSLTGLAQSLHVEERKNGVFVGIAHIGFTENEAYKKTLSATGEAASVPKRNALITNTRQVTASRVLRQLEKEKFWGIHCKVGIANHFMVRFFPRLLFQVFKWNYKG